MGRTNSIANSLTSIQSSGVLDEGILPSWVFDETFAPVCQTESARDWVVTGTAEVSRQLASSKINQCASSKVENPVGESGRTKDALQMSQDCFSVGKQ